MADLGNSKIKDTYTLVLQTDASGNLQKLDGTTPSPFIVNGNLRYVDGNQALNYVLTSDASGNASWTEAGGTSYWSATTDGSITPSGLTTTIKTEGDLTVSGTVRTNTITTTGSTTGDTLYVRAGILNMQNEQGSREYYTIRNDAHTFWLNNAEAVIFDSEGPNKGFMFDGHDAAAGVYFPFKIFGDSSTPMFETDPENLVSRFRYHVSVGDAASLPSNTVNKYGLAVTGSSLFYSGGSTNTNTNAIEVFGDISGTTDLYLGSPTHTASTITAEETLTIKGNGLNDYLYLANDRLDMYMDGATLVEMTPTDIVFNASANNVDFNVKSEDGTQLIRTRAEHNIVRLLDHVSINKPTGWVQVDEQQQALAVSGTSVFYSGGTSHNTEAIVAIGNISGTTNLYIDENMYSGTTNLLDIFASSAITNQDVYWSANTDGSISPSGLTTTVQTEGDLRVSGMVYTTDIRTTGGTSADTLTIEAGTISLRNQDGLTEYLTIAPDGFTFYLNDTVSVQFNDGSQKYMFDGRPGSATDWYTFNFAGNNGYDVMLLDPQWEVARFKEHMAIGATYGTWSNAMAIQYGLYVSGSSRFLSGGTYVSTNAIEALGDISGTTDLYIDQNTFIGGTLHVSGDTFYEGALSGTGNVTTVGDLFTTNITASNNLYVSGDTFYEGAFSATGAITAVGDIEGENITSRNNLYVSGDTFYGSSTVEGNVEIGGNFIADGSSNDIDIRNAGTTSILLRGRGNQNSYIGNDSFIANLGIGTTNPNETLTVAGNISGDTNLYIRHTTFTGNLNISGDTFYEGALSGTGDISTVGDITMGEYLYHDGDPDTYLRFQDDIVNITAGGSSMIKLDMTASQDKIQLNNSNSDIDLNVMGDDGSVILSTDAENNRVGVNTSTANEALTVVGAISGTTDLYIDDNIRGLRGQFGDSPVGAGPIRDMDIRGEGSVYLRLESTTNANQVIEFMNDQEPDFSIYNKFGDGGLLIASDDKTFLIIGADDGDTIDLNAHTTISGNTYISGDTFYEGALSGTGNISTTENLYVSGDTYLTASGTEFAPRPNLYFFANCDAQTVGPASDGSFPSTNTTDVSFGVTHNNNTSIFVWSAEELTITRAGLYKFTYNVTLETGADGTTHNRAGGGITLLRKPDGGAYAVVAGTESYVYCRMATIDMNTGATSVIYNVTADDVFKIVFIRTGAQTASSKLGTIIAGTSWTVEAVT